jgi:hypothetical protein
MGAVAKKRVWIMATAIPEISLMGNSQRRNNVRKRKQNAAKYRRVPLS